MLVTARILKGTLAALWGSELWSSPDHVACRELALDDAPHLNSWKWFVQIGEQAATAVTGVVCERHL